jgi:3',5'-cyclic AMP phosphodiesterase CpdA
MRRSRAAISIPLAAFSFGLSVLCSCTPGTGPSLPESARITKGPYLQNVTQDGITVMWETSQPTLGSVLYGFGGELVNEAAKEVVARLHEIRLTALSPATEYSYRVLADGVSSATYTFTTAMPPGSEFRFAFYGDNKDGPINHERVANAILASDPNFAIHNGDLVNTGWVAKQWDRLFFGPASRLMHSVTLFPVLGNHEKNAQLYFDYFSLPGNERWYSFDFGNAHFVVLDSDVQELAEGGQQLRWLEDDLATNDADWTFVNFHHPPFSASRDYHSTERLRRKAVLHPIFERHRVDMVFSGHDHDYERTRPIGTRANGHAITYVVAGNGGTPMHWAATREWTAYSERVFGFVTVDVDGPRAVLQAHNDSGTVLDELVVDKSDGTSYASYLESAVEFDGILDPVVAAAHYAAGDDLLDDAAYEAALAEFMAAVEADPTTIRAIAGIAECLLELGQPEEAVEWARRGVEILPQCPEPYEVLVAAHHALGNDGAALEWGTIWADIEPDTPDAHEAMAAIHADRGELAAAIAELERAVAILPSDASLQFELAALYEQTGQTEQALLATVRGVYWFTQEEDQDEEEIQKYVDGRQRVLASLEESRSP